MSSPIRPGFFFCMHLVVIIHTRVMDKICPFSFSVVCVKLMLFSDIFLFIVPAFHVESLAGSVRWAETYQLGKLKWRRKKNLTANHHIQQEMGLYYYIKGGLFAHFSSIADNLFASVLNPCLSNKYGLRSSLKFRFFLCPAFTLLFTKAESWKNGYW